jgi:CRP-like cAMP-binding protein
MPSDTKPWGERVLPKPFDGLECGLLAALAEEAQLEDWSARTWLREPTSVASEALLLLEGEAEIRVSDRLLNLVRAPVTFGLTSLLRAEAPIAGLRALTPVTLLRLPLALFSRLLTQSGTLAARVQRHLCEELEAQQEQSVERVRGLDDCFIDPGARLPAGPYAFDDVELKILILNGDKARLARLLPPGLTLTPWLQDRYLLTICDVRQARFAGHVDAGVFGYREVTPFIPCVSRSGRFGAFVPELYPDAYHAILLGREVFGFPKRHGRIWLAEQSAHLALGSDWLLHARWQRETALSVETFGAEFLRVFAPESGPAAWLGRGLGAALGWAERNPSQRLPDFRVFTHKLIAAADDARRSCVDELVEVPFSLGALGGFARLESASLWLDPRHGVLHGSLLGAFAARVGFTFERARVLETYAVASAPQRAGRRSSIGALLRRSLPGSKISRP